MLKILGLFKDENKDFPTDMFFPWAKRKLTGNRWLAFPPIPKNCSPHIPWEAPATARAESGTSSTSEEDLAWKNGSLTRKNADAMGISCSYMMIDANICRYNSGAPNS